MKKFFAVILLGSGFHLTTLAQHKSDYVRNMMTERILTCDDIGYNSALLIPRLYGEKKADTLNAVMAYWQRNCGMTEPGATFGIIYAIEQNTFNKQLTHATHVNNFTDAAVADTSYFNRSIIANLYSYKYVFDNSNLSDTTLDDVAMAYQEYYTFLHSMAYSLIKESRLNVVERFLVRFYNNPDETSIDELSSATYNGTSIQAAYMRQHQAQNSLNGFDYAIIAGAWVPTGNLGMLPGAPYFGFSLGGRRNKLTIDFTCTIGAPTAQSKTYLVANNDSLSTSNNYTAFYLGLDGAYDIAHTKKSELDLLGGIGYQGLQVLNGSGSAPTLTINSPNINAGIGYKIKLNHRVKNNAMNVSYTVHSSYIALQAKYNLLFFNNSPGTSLSGNAFTIGIVYGATTRIYKH